MEQSNKEFFLVLQGVKPSKTQSPTTAEDKNRMKVIPYALAIGSIKYAILCTRSIVYPTLFLAREYNSDLGVDHWTAVKIILRDLERTKEMFLGYGGDKEFVVRSYVDASFDTDLDDSESQSRYILKVGAIS